MQETEFTVADFVIVKVVKKMKNNKFFFKKKIFRLGKIFPTQINNSTLPRHIRRNLSYADPLVGKGWFLSYFPPFKTCMPLKFAPSLLQNGYFKPVII